MNSGSDGLYVALLSDLVDLGSACMDHNFLEHPYSHDSRHKPLDHIAHITRRLRNHQRNYHHRVADLELGYASQRWDSIKRRSLTLRNTVSSVSKFQFRSLLAHLGQRFGAFRESPSLQ